MNRSTRTSTWRRIVSTSARSPPRRADRYRVPYRRPASLANPLLTNDSQTQSPVTRPVGHTNGQHTTMMRSVTTRMPTPNLEDRRMRFGEEEADPEHESAEKQEASIGPCERPASTKGYVGHRHEARDPLRAEVPGDQEGKDAEQQQGSTSIPVSK